LAGASSQTPLGELTGLPQTQYLDYNLLAIQSSTVGDYSFWFFQMLACVKIPKTDKSFGK